MHLVVMLPKGMHDRTISMRAAGENLWLWPLSSAYTGKAPRQGFILGFGSTKASEMRSAVRRLASVLTGEDGELKFTAAR
jgi:DNA-binding transcriptional MocR family regulator